MLANVSVEQAIQAEIFEAISSSGSVLRKCELPMQATYAKTQVNSMIESNHEKFEFF